MSDSQALGDLIKQIPEDEQIDSVCTDGAYDTKYCRQVIAHWQAHAVIPEEMPSLGKTLKSVQENETSYSKRLNIWAESYGKNGRGIIVEVWWKPRCIVLNY